MGLADYLVGGSSDDGPADEPTEDAAALKCARDALRAAKANDAAAYLQAVRAMVAEDEG